MPSDLWDELPERRHHLAKTLPQVRILHPQLKRERSLAGELWAQPAGIVTMSQRRSPHLARARISEFESYHRRTPGSGGEHPAWYSCHVDAVLDHPEQLFVGQFLEVGGVRVHSFGEFGPIYAGSAVTIHAAAFRKGARARSPSAPAVRRTGSSRRTRLLRRERGKLRKTGASH
jgi:hypothetical protein